MHDGYGFVTQHSALSKWFEVVMQAVNPVVTLPYWDYTIEGEVHVTQTHTLADFCIPNPFPYTICT